MEKVKIIFADGTEVNAERNGDCLILKKRTTLPTDLSVVTVRGDDGDTVYHNAELTESASVDGRYWFAFTEASPADLVTRKMQENIRAIAELTDVDLDSPDPEKEISLKERVNDLEIAVCELMDTLA